MFHLCLVLAVVSAPSPNPILESVPQRQQKAYLSNRGALGCGRTLTINTSHGALTLKTGLDPIHVFGSRVAATDLLVLLEARVESNRSWFRGPMSGEVGDLCYVCLKTLALAGEPAAIPIMAELTEDKDETIHQWAAIGLNRLAEADPKREPMIRQALETVQAKAAHKRRQANVMIGGAVALAVMTGGFAVYKRRRARRINLLAHTAEPHP